MTNNVQDFMNNVFHKKEAIQYPRFIKLIIADLMKKFLNIPQRIDEDYHSIKDDIPLVSVYTTGNVLIQGMLILDEFLTEEIRVTDDFKKSIPRAHMTPTVSIASPQGKKRKQIVGESSSLRKSHKITIRKKKQSTTSIPPPGEDRERDEVAEATILSLTLHKTALAAEAQEILIEKEKKDEYIEKEQKDKEIEKEKNIDDVEKTDEVVKEKYIDVAMGSMVFRKVKMQTPIPLPTRSPRKVSSSDKTISEELTASTKILPGSIAGMCRRRGQIWSHIKNKCITHEFFMSKIQEVLDHCNNVMPELTFSKTNEMINKEMPCLFNLAVNKDYEVDPINAHEMISKEFATHAPKMIEELFRKHTQHTTLNLYITTSSSTAGKLTADLQHDVRSS
ncbi:hypothetical protein Tco_0644615 [Tanacetum coccineum]